MSDHVADPRAALDRLLTDKGIDYARLSQVIGRNPAYIQQYIKRGSPRRLAEQDRARIAAYLGVSEALLGGPVQRVATPARVRGRRTSSRLARPSCATAATGGRGPAPPAECFCPTLCAPQTTACARRRRAARLFL